MHVAAWSRRRSNCSSSAATSRPPLRHPDLQERELIKRATLTAVLARALHDRGVPEPAASLAADMGLAVFYIGFVRWLDDPAGRELVDIVHEGFEQLRAVATGS